MRSDPAVQQLAQRAAALADQPGRAILGITGPPAAGKSTLADRLLAELAPDAAYVPLDGFHLAHQVLEELGTVHRKGAPDTFDAAGYVALLRRLRDPAEGTVYAPQFRREIEDSLASAIPVLPDVRLVITEGNYLLVRSGPWAELASLLDEVWYLDLDEPTRLRWLADRHVRYGRDAAAAAARASRPRSAQRRADRGDQAARRPDHLGQPRRMGTMLTPRDSRSRDCHRLDGVWRFRFDPGGEGVRQGWWREPLPGAREMAVPASYNDLVTDAAEREHVGDVWYQRDVWVPAGWAGQRIVLRCDAATHHGTLWADAVQVAEHTGGYTPFEADVTEQVRCGERLRVTVRVGNELTMATIPPGVTSRGASGQQRQRYFHDFFNYAGLHRSVWLYATPRHFVADISVRTAFDPGTGTGRVSYQARGGGRRGHVGPAPGRGWRGAGSADRRSRCPHRACGAAVVPGQSLPVPAGRRARSGRVPPPGGYQDGRRGRRAIAAQRAAGGAARLRHARRRRAARQGP